MSGDKISVKELAGMFNFCSSPEEIVLKIREINNVL